ncbi:MAG: ribulose-phosphate 3-epimerase, partial [Patescibacteria group bacterium]|nr:ribulose-phosphate 3-epimerase [Patescibacteria group bacterium]
SFEVHLMVKDVQAAILKWDYPWVKKIIFHSEADIDPREGCRQIRTLKKLSGVAISPQTRVEKVLPYLADVDTILVMMVEPGRNGAPFLPDQLSKVRALRAAAPQANIEVDGGISPDTLKSCAAAGANLFVVGSYLNNREFGARMQTLKQALQ